MRDRFSTVRLGDYCSKIGSGATPRGGKEVYINSGVSLIRSQNIYNNYFDYSGLAYISDQHADELSNVVVEQSDILLNITGDSVARAFQVPGNVLPARVNQHVSIIRPNPKIFDSCFLYYFFISPFMQSHMLSLAGSGGTRKALTKGMIEDFEVPVLNIEEQHRIAHILGTLDDKIELNRRMNHTLETIARAIFKSWFVDFNPVRAKLDGRDTGLPPEIDALFPDSFEDIESAMIPRGWRVGILEDLCERTENGGTPKRSESLYWDGGTIPWLTSGEVRQNIIIDTANFITQEGLENSSAKLWPVGVTVVALYGATAGEVTLLAKEMCANQACSALIPKEGYKYFVYLQTSASSKLLANQARGSAQQNLSKGIVTSFPTIIPPIEVAESFEKKIAPMFGLYISNLKLAKSLAELRDTLLPQLMRGELRV